MLSKKNKKRSNQTQMAQILDFTCRDFNEDIMNMLKKIIFKELKESMVLIKECLQGNFWKLKIYDMEVLILKISITEWKYLV